MAVPIEIVVQRLVAFDGGTIQQDHGGQVCIFVFQLLAPRQDPVIL